jgi:hypothetical protein
VHPAGS